MYIYSLTQLFDNPIFRFSTYCKLFVAMGLSWSLELLAWLLRVLADEAPKELIMALNVANIFQVRDRPVGIKSKFYALERRGCTSKKLSHKLI